MRRAWAAAQKRPAAHNKTWRRTKAAGHLSAVARGRVAVSVASGVAGALLLVVVGVGAQRAVVRVALVRVPGPLRAGASVRIGLRRTSRMIPLTYLGLEVHEPGRVGFVFK